MKENTHIHVTVGQSDADILGRDNRALQAAVDYVFNLGGHSNDLPLKIRNARRFAPALRRAAFRCLLCTGKEPSHRKSPHARR